MVYLTDPAKPDKNVFGFHQQELHFIAKEWDRGEVELGLTMGQCCAAQRPPVVTVNADHLAKLLHLFVVLNRNCSRQGRERKKKMKETNVLLSVHLWQLRDSPVLTIHLNIINSSGYAW